MNWKEYLELSEKTLSKEFNCSKNDEFLLHGVMGILTELDELLDSEGDDVNKGEEIADSFWYIAIIDREFNLGLELNRNLLNFNYSRSQDIVLDLYKKTSKLLDYIKKKLFYNKEINRDEFSTLTVEIFDLFLFYSHFNSINVPYSLNRNIEKLKARYGDKFSSERAINRDLQNERIILEK